MIRRLRCATLTPLLLGLVACSSAPKLRIESNPPGATVLSAGGAILGITPLDVPNDKMESIVLNGHFSLFLDKARYVPQLFSGTLQGFHQLTAELKPLDENYFATRFLQDYGEPVNKMARELLQIQSLLFLKKEDEAERRLEAFFKDFPNVAASYVLAANIESSRGRYSKARAHLKRATSIDPSDQVAVRMLRELERTPNGDRGRDR